MQYLRQKAANNIDEVRAKWTKTILESIVVAGTKDESDPDSRQLSDESVLGNIFFTLMAGYETAGNTLAFTILLLATYPEYQRTIQEELDSRLASRSSDSWTIDTDYHTLQKGFLGAVLKEVLRLYNPVSFVLRKAIAPTTVKDSQGAEHTIPANTTIAIGFAAANQNPHIWAPNPVPEARRAELHHSQAIDFYPWRWLDGSADEDNWWAFGYGRRKCPGMAFAQTGWSLY